MSSVLDSLASDRCCAPASGSVDNSDIRLVITDQYIELAGRRLQSTDLDLECISKGKVSRNLRLMGASHNSESTDHDLVLVNHDALGDVATGGARTAPSELSASLGVGRRCHI